MNWQPISSGYATSESYDAAQRLVADHGEPKLVTGTYADVVSARNRDALLLLTKRSVVRGVAAARLSIIEDPEVASACGESAIVVPLLVVDPSSDPADYEFQLSTLRSSLRQIHGDHRITVHLPAIRNTLANTFKTSDFRADSALSIARIVPDLLRSEIAEGYMIRPAESNDAAAVADIFAESLHHLASLSPYVTFTEAAVRAVRDRIATSVQGRTSSGSRVDIAVDSRETPVAVCEYSWSYRQEGRMSLLPAGTNGCVHWIATSETMQGGGIGRQLVHRSTSFMYEQGVRTLYAFHLLGEKTAEGFWRRLGLSQAWTTWES